MITVEFYMTGKPKGFKRFGTIREAQAFMQGLSVNPECECYSIVQ